MKVLTGFFVSQRKVARVFLIASLAILAFGVTSCGGDSAPTSSGPQAATPTATVEPTSTPVPPPTPTATIPPIPPTTPSPTAVPDTPSPEATEEPTPTTIAVQETGRETAGSLIVIAGVEIQLPSDVWVDKWKTDMACAEGKKCPATPYWILYNGEGTIEIDADGKIWQELIGCGDPAPFASIKKLLP